MHYRNALITGASSGIGRELAITLAREGTHVIVCARRQAELDQLVAEIGAAGGSAETVVLDVGQVETVLEAVQQAHARTGGLELVVANAGIGEPSFGTTMTWESVEPVLRVNLMGAVATLTAALPGMVRRDRGHLVGVSSLAGYRGLPGNAAYSASKAGLSTFLEALRLDLLDTQVRVTTVHPGFVRTPMTDKNRFPMPFMVEVDAAARRIVRALPKAPAHIDFPLPTSLVMRSLRFMPQGIFDMIARRSSRLLRG